MDSVDSNLIILQVEIVVGKPGTFETIDEFCMDIKECLKYGGQAMEQLNNRANARLNQSGMEVKRLAYCDHDDDWCTLNKETLLDALSFAVPSQLDASVGRLRLLASSQEMAASPAAPAETPKPAEAPRAPPSQAEVLEALNRLAVGVDLRRLVPKLATIGLRIIEAEQQPALFPLVEGLVALQEGNLKADSLPSMVPDALTALVALPPDVACGLLQRFQMQAAEAADELRQEQAKDGREDIEVHRNVQCDGCDMIPILGPRYKSLERDDYDLCAACFRGRPAQGWARVRSDLRGDVVTSYYAPTAGNADSPVLHRGVMCDGCGMSPLTGRRFRSLNRENFDLCEACHSADASPDLYEEICVVAATGNTLDAAAAAPEAGVPEASLVEPCVPPEAPAESAPAPEPMEEAPPERNPIDSAAAEVALAALDAVAARSALAALLRHADSSVRSAAAGAISAASEAAENAKHRQEDVDMGEEPKAPSLVDEPTLMEPEPPLAFEVPEQLMPVRAQAAPSAAVLSGGPLVLGIEAQEVEEARGDVTSEMQEIIQTSGAQQAFRVGRVLLPTETEAAGVPACAKVVVANTGEEPWPESAVLALVAGEDFGFPQLQLGAVRPGEAAEIVMDMLLPSRASPGAARSAWAFVDAASGAALGPLLLFEVLWVQQ